MSPALAAPEAAALLQCKRERGLVKRDARLAPWLDNPNQGQSERTRRAWFCFVLHYLSLVLSHTKSSLPLQDCLVVFLLFFSETSLLAYGKMLLRKVIRTCQGTREAKRM